MQSREFEVFWSHKGKNKNGPRHQARARLLWIQQYAFSKAAAWTCSRPEQSSLRCVWILRPTSNESILYSVHVCVCMYARVLCLLLWIANKCMYSCVCVLAAVFECGCMYAMWCRQYLRFADRLSWRRSFVWRRPTVSESSTQHVCMMRTVQCTQQADYTQSASHNPQSRIFPKSTETAIWRVRSVIEYCLYL